MKKGKLSGQSLTALIMLTLGVMLLVFCITVEGEPGALPLFLTLGSVLWLIVLRFRGRLQKSSKA